MLKTPSTARRAKLFAAAVLAAYAMGAAGAYAGVTTIGAGANVTPLIGDPSLYPNPKDPVGANGSPSGFNVGANSGSSGFSVDPGNKNTGGSDPDPKVAAVPEPASWALMAFGFAGLGFAAYRAKRRPALI
jgi:hypothetical protein